MNSRQYLKGFVLLAILMREPGLVLGDSPSPSSSVPTGSVTTAVSSSTMDSNSATATSMAATSTGMPGTSNTATTTAMSLPSAQTSTTAGTQTNNNFQATNANMVTTATAPSSSNMTTASNNLTASDGNTTMASSYDSLISCPVFTCNTSACYDTFMNQTAIGCGQNISFCELWRWADMSYSVRCSAGCLSMPCANQTHTGCAADCCNTTGCLNATLLSMIPTTAAPTTTTIRTTATPTTTTTSTTIGKNGKKCHKLSCTGERCYKDASLQGVVMLCAVGQDYCQLKKTVMGAVMTWTAGCGGNCMEETMCTSTAVDCYQECCNATQASSCLKLDGSLNMPNSAASPSSTLVLVASALLTWLLCSQLHAD